MGFFTILYEIVRNDYISIILIILLLIGIIGVLNTKEETGIHILFSIIAFGSIILFMYYLPVYMMIKL